MSVLTDLATLSNHVSTTYGTDGSVLTEKKKKVSAFLKSITKGRKDISNPQGLGGFIRNAKANHLAQWKKKGKKGKKK